MDFSEHIATRSERAMEQEVKNTKYWVNSMSNSFSNVLDSANASCGGAMEVPAILESTSSFEDRFRVDRRKLEQLIIGAHECADSAEAFFNSIMESTHTLIAWPHRLKMGAKSRKDICNGSKIKAVFILPIDHILLKRSGTFLREHFSILNLIDTDPYVRIYGRTSDVKKAKEKVMAVLDSRGTRTIMKLDISYTDHSHIIGKGGQTVRRVMEVTGCHIHFPDSNRNNAFEKSNQVSIAGEMEGVEQARHQLRMLTPLVFSFELPVKSPVSTIPDQTSSIIWMVQERYNVHVIFRKGAKLFSKTVLVKGSESELEKVEEATLILIQHLRETQEDEVPVQMTMEITPHHHMIVRGYGSYNLKMIMSQTSTMIAFPDPADTNLSPLKKSTVTITGSIHNVYLARQLLVGSLPLVLMFDMGEECAIASDRLNEIMKKHEVEISVRLKPKYRVYSVCIKGVERNAGNVYEARKQLLNSNEPSLVPNIPRTYFLAENLQQSLGGVDHKIAYGGSFSALPMLPPTQSLSPTSQGRTFFSNDYQANSELNTYQGGKEKSGVLALVSPAENSECNTVNDLPAKNSLFPLLESHQILVENCDKEDLSAVSSNVSTLSSPNRSPTNSPRSATISMHGIDSGYGETCDSESARPSSGSAICENDQEMCKSENDTMRNISSDYESIKYLAVKAMQARPDASKYRVPNIKWSGYGFSHSMPGSVLKINIPEPRMDTVSEDDSSKESAFPHDDKMDSICVPDYTPAMTMDLVLSSRRLKGGISDINTLLESIGLEKYVYLFTSQEIDITTFMTLSDNDLRQLGISTFGARRKILMTISELKKNMNFFNGDAAPGAERKSFNSSHWDNYMN